MKVLKFGGTSLGSAARMKQVAQLVLAAKERRIIVLSAVAGTTNALVEIGELALADDVHGSQERIGSLRKTYTSYIDQLYSHRATQEKAKEKIAAYFKLLDDLVNTPFKIVRDKEILAMGELISTRLFVYLLEEMQVRADWINALDFMRTVGGEPDMSTIETGIHEILEGEDSADIFVTQGFICRNESGEVDNLKRGGSDYTASILGATCNASEIQIWTDIDGIHNNDPRVVNHTAPVKHLSYAEAAELAYFGAKVLHPATVHPARLRSIPVRLLNTLEPTATGTLIDGMTTNSERRVKAIAAKDGIAAINVKSHRMLMAYGFLRKVFEVFEQFATPIDMITTSEVAVSITIDDVGRLPEILNALTEYGEIQVDKDQTIICVVGDFGKDETGVAFEILDCLKDIPIRMISSGGSQSNISLLVDTRFKQRTMHALNVGLFDMPAV